ncbi:vacuolar ATPase assembly integral membrane protein vma21 [Dispira parvispora]|uniref:Vacuolar ATPase assembly integral membrane protein vma21 n=1 Tax=Dispira parvispora TaxID=1520584 RepID=A0A9W8EAA3_9FUNG|nr:vacuolar ATPase assembly integral membrane protein vma21 [Dispira parvispora]
MSSSSSKTPPKSTAVAPSSQPQVSGSVWTKLLLTTVAMVFGPVGSYFLSRDYLFSGDTFYSALVAIAVANAILISFVVVAALEDTGPAEVEKKSKASTKKDK